MTKQRSYILHDVLLVNWLQKTISVELAQAVKQVLDSCPIVDPFEPGQHLEQTVEQQFCDVIRQFEVPLKIELFSGGVS